MPINQFKNLTVSVQFSYVALYALQQSTESSSCILTDESSPPQYKHQQQQAHGSYSTASVVGYKN